MGKKIERMVVPTLSWKLSGAGGMEHPYLVVSGLQVERVERNVGVMLFWAKEFDDAENVPNQQSREAIAEISKRFEPYIKNGTFTHFGYAVTGGVYEMRFRLESGVDFFTEAVRLSLLVFKLFDIQIVRAENKARARNRVYVREDPRVGFVSEKSWLQDKLRKTLDLASREGQ